ncbi:alanine--glyoxylate aminotransferase family protein [Ammoniphilus sp. CFH 90114]|uniref:pyridoxal-phosphate-dependent aminotransferase family protein n=1 Tax=Ammoniphilus sp. CFH 90114 TaxID=2493665 RepID=UPI00100E07B8|nr:alanine--glyoxylate aminotransferase family protein [Ammoniphilus sp. CFH 90114]RXT00618.1 alanine--glyoxylate aminotransferase family protein [Ammoniphilus sp. CFH 90114]
MLGAQDLLLMTPGPTKIPPSVQKASGQATMHHRSKPFAIMLGELLEGLKPFFGTSQPILPVHTTGRGAMEAAITNLFSQGDPILSICNGKFGGFFAEIGERYGCQVTRAFASWEEEVELSQLVKLIDSIPDLKAITVVHSDTSSGILNPIEQIAALTKKRDILLIVDGISSIGSVPFEFDKWGVDVAITASQKGLMSFPGLAFVVLNDKAWKAEQTSTLPKFYTEFKEILKSVTKPKPDTPGTTPVSLVAAVHEAVKLLTLEGKENVFKRMESNGAYLRQEMNQLGFQTYPPNLIEYSPTVSMFKVPEGYTSNDIQSFLQQHHGIFIAKGLGNYKDGFIRIGHMGDIRLSDIERTIAAVKDGLTREG